MPEDLFSNNSDGYSKYRPTFPVEFIDYILSFVKERELLWDVATGNGQAAKMFAPHFQKVIATDLSSSQLKFAPSLPNVEYHTESSEDLNSTLLKPNSVDLITVSTAIHWFSLEPFYERVKKVMKPGGILACWTYWLPTITPEIDQTQQEYQNLYLKKYHNPSIEFVKQGYETLPFDFEAPSGHDTNVNGVNNKFKIERTWDFEMFCHNLQTYSSSQRYLEEYKEDPVTLFRDRLLEAWGGDPKKSYKLTFDLYLLLGKV